MHCADISYNGLEQKAQSQREDRRHFADRLLLTDTSQTHSHSKLGHQLRELLPFPSSFDINSHQMGT